MNNENNNVKKKYHVNDIVLVNNKKCKIIFGPFERGFHLFYEVEDNGQIYSVNSKNIKKI